MKTASLHRMLICGACSWLMWATPSEARFLQVDPVGYQDQVNLYAYVGNDPINLTDPTGNRSCGRHCWESDEAIAGRPNVTAPAAAREYATRNSGQVHVRNQQEAIHTNEKFSAVRPNGNTFMIERVATRGALSREVGNVAISSGRAARDTVMVMHGQGETIVPGPGDDAVVINNGLPNGIEFNGRFGIVEFLEGRFRFTLEKGKLEPRRNLADPGDGVRIEQRLNEYTARLSDENK